MALPVVKSLLDCTDFSRTVQPYIPQLQTLPKIFFESATSIAALKQLYYDTNPLISSLWFSLAITPIFLVVSEINKNYSQVDRVWSILPTIYNVHYAIHAYTTGIETTRVGAIALISTIWSTRLTYNYYRKGGYSIGSEDYRWKIVKDYVGPGLFFILNVVFICVAQSLLLFSVTMPTYVILLVSRLAQNHSQVSSWTLGDSIAALAMLSCITLSFVADQQQWNYHQAKSQYRNTAKVPNGYTQEELDRGFLTKGLFAISRHPNFAAEQGVWSSLYFWSCVATKKWYNWTGVAVLAYLFLFQASTWLTELLSSGKYPDYKEYQKQVGMFLPSGSRAKLGSASNNTDDTALAKQKDEIKARERYDLRN